MSNRSVVKKFALSGFLLFSLIFLFSPGRTNAQVAASPQFFITWKASNSYIPPFYQGKALPSPGSEITASLELLFNGKILNLKSQMIYWYLDDVLIGGGSGVQQVTFSPFGAPPTLEALSVKLPQYDGGLTHLIKIPFASPVAVIYAPYPNQEFSVNPVAVKAIPFFFKTSSASNLSFSWVVNGQAGSNTENPQEANITLPQGTSAGTNINISLTVTDPVGSTVATADQNLIYQNQL